jgi:hypothetical protein
MRDMHAAGEPVDPVTVTWEAARRGLPAEAAELEGGNAPLALAGARDVYRYGLLARIGRAGLDISAAAQDPQLRLGVLLRDAGQRLRGLEPEPRPAAGRARQPDGRPAPAEQRTSASRSAAPRRASSRPQESSSAAAERA